MASKLAQTCREKYSVMSAVKGNLTHFKKIFGVFTFAQNSVLIRIILVVKMFPW